MSRPKKLEIVKPEYPVVTFDGMDFEIHPISHRNDEGAYEDSARFLTRAIPLVSRLFTDILRLGGDNPAVLDRVDQAQKAGEDQAAVIVDLVGLISKMDIGSLLDEIADTMPSLAAIACHYTDPDVTEKDIKRWSKGPLNPMLWKAVVGQLKADNMLTQVGELRGLLSEFGQTQ